MENKDDNCPFCGAGAHNINIFESKHVNYAYAWCEVCGARGPIRDTMLGAAAAWRKRGNYDQEE